MARLSAWSSLPGWRWTSLLQRLSDLAGFAVLGVVIARLPRRPVPGAARPWLFWLVTALVVVALVGVRTMLEPDWA